LSEFRRIYVMHHLHDMNDLPAFERWFWRYHAPEVMRGSRLLRYVNYRAVVPPPRGAEEYGFYNYAVHEDILLHAPASGPGSMDVAICTVPGDPTEDFLGSEVSMDEKTVLRWLIYMKYPEGVSEQEGEDWYLNVHAREVMQQPGLTRFFSYKALPHRLFAPPKPGARRFMHPNTRMHLGWNRVSEQWYANPNGWRKSIVESPPRYTAPPWASHDRYPFLKPFVDFASMFVLERPTDDYIRAMPPFYV
jgi:hypothetical protein